MKGWFDLKMNFYLKNELLAEDTVCCEVQILT